MNATNDPFGSNTSNQLGRDAIVSKPVKGVTKYFGQPARMNEHAVMDHPDFTVGRRIFERRCDSVPQRTTPKQHRTPEEQLFPEDPRASRICLNSAVKTGATASERMDFERNLYPQARCPTHTDPRLGELTKGFTVRYKSTC